MKSITTLKSLAEGFRVFTDVKGLDDAAVRDDPAGDLNVVTQLCVSRACKDDDNENALAGAGGWFPADNGQTFAARLPPTIQTTLAAELAALVIALERTQSAEELVITSISKSLIVGLTRSLQTMEDRGWIGAQNRDLTKKIVASLRKHSGDARFRRATKGEDSLKRPIQRAKDRMGRPGTTDLDLSIPSN